MVGEGGGDTLCITAGMRFNSCTSYPSLPSDQVRVGITGTYLLQPENGDTISLLGAFHVVRTHLGGGGGGGVKPPIHFHCVLHAKRGGWVQIPCRICVRTKWKAP